MHVVVLPQNLGPATTTAPEVFNFNSISFSTSVKVQNSHNFQSKKGKHKKPWWQPAASPWR